MTILIIILVVLVIGIIGYFVFSGRTPKNNYTEETLKQMSIDELHNLYMNLACLIMSAADEPASRKIPFGTYAYGCKTWGEARNLFDLIAKIHNEKIQKQH